MDHCKQSANVLSDKSQERNTKKERKNKIVSSILVEANMINTFLNMAIEKKKKKK